MAKAINEHVLPRPVEDLPSYADARARRSLADKLEDAFELPGNAAEAISNAVVDPSAVRKSIGEPTNPEVERIPVPGGTVLGIRTSVWARRAMPDPRNPRTLPQRRHPFAVEPGQGGEDAKFRPIADPDTPDSYARTVGALAVRIENREHLTWASQLAAQYVLAQNDWRGSIQSQGVMEAVWLAATEYVTDDGDDATALTTVEGSSRMTAVHKINGIRSADVPWDQSDAALRAHIRKLNEALESGATRDQQVALRTERVPALILVGFEPYVDADIGFPTAVKSLVALRHVDPPQPWGDGPENEALADEVLQELYRKDLISETERNYYAGASTKAEALAAHLSADPAVRAAGIVRLLTKVDEEHRSAIRIAVTSQSTRKKISAILLNDLATALILRAVADEPRKTEQVRRYMRRAFSKAVHKEMWEASGRDIDTLVKAALNEVGEAIASGQVGEVGPSSIELAVRGTYPLVVSGRLNADRGTSGNDQPDRRTPGEVVDAMRQTVQGVHQLGQSLRDFAAERPIRAVDEDGKPLQTEDGGDVYVNDVLLRTEYPAPGRTKSKRPGHTPDDLYQNAVHEMGEAMDGLRASFDVLLKVVGDDGQSVVDAKGVDFRLCDAWRSILGDVDEELAIWKRTFTKKNGAAASSPVVANDDEEDEAEQDEFDDEFGEDEDEVKAA